MAITLDGTVGVTSPDFIPSSSNIPTNGLFLPAANTVGLATGSTEQLRLDASGNLGLGVTPNAWISTTKNFEFTSGSIYSTTNGRNLGLFQNAYVNSSASYIYVASRAATWYNQTAGAHIWYNAPSGTAGAAISFTQAMTLDASGNLLVGMTSPGFSQNGFNANLNQGANIWGVGVGGNSVSSSLTGYSLYSTSGSAYKFYVQYSGSIYATSTTITAISDQRLKENIRDLDDGLATILALKPRKFDWKEGKGKDIKDDRGFIAQEFEQVFPDLIDTWKDEPPEGEEPYKSVRPDLIPVMVKAIQELSAKVTALEAK